MSTPATPEDVQAVEQQEAAAQAQAAATMAAAVEQTQAGQPAQPGQADPLQAYRELKAQTLGLSAAMLTGASVSEINAQADAVVAAARQLAPEPSPGARVGGTPPPQPLPTGLAAIEAGVAKARGQ